MAYAPGDPNTPSAQRTRANGWIGSKYVGGAAPTTPIAPAGAPVNSTPTQPAGRQVFAPPPPNRTVNVTAPGFDPTHPGTDVETIGQQNVVNNSQSSTPAPGPSGTPPSTTQQWTGPAYQGTAATSNTQGFVRGKLNDPSLGTSNKYQGGRYLQSHPGDVNGLVQQPGFEGWQVVGPDKVRGVGADGIPGNADDSTYDVRNANGSVQWTAISGPAWDKNGIAGVNSLGVNSSMAHDGIKGNYAGANAVASDAARAAGQNTFGYAGSGGGGTTSSQSSSYQSGGNNIDDQLIRELINRSHQSLDVNSANDPTLRAQMRPYEAQVEREKRNYLADLAERSGPTANLRGETRLANEHAGQTIGSHESGLVGQEIAARREEIQAALNQRGALMSDAQHMALQRELAKLNDATQRLGISTNHNEFTSDLGFRATDRDNYWAALNSGLL